MKVEETDAGEKVAFQDEDGRELRPVRANGAVAVVLQIVGNSESKMRFDRNLAGELAGLLQRFAETGKLAEPTEDEDDAEREALRDAALKSEQEKVAFIEARGWTRWGNDSTRWSKPVKGGSLDAKRVCLLEDAYRVEMEEQPKPVVPGYPFAEQGEVVDAEYLNRPAIELAAVEWLEAHEATLRVHARLGKASSLLNQYRGAVGSLPLVVRFDGDLHLITFEEKDLRIVTTEAMTVEQAQAAFDSEAI